MEEASKEVETSEVGKGAQSSTEGKEGDPTVLVPGEVEEVGGTCRCERG